MKSVSELSGGFAFDTNPDALIPLLCASSLNAKSTVGVFSLVSYSLLTSLLLVECMYVLPAGLKKLEGPSWPSCD